MSEIPLPRFGLRGDCPELGAATSDSAAHHALIGFLREHAPSASFARSRPEPSVHLLGVRLDDELYALPVDRVREVVRAQALTRVPSAPEHVRGLQSLRGALLPVLEVRTRLGLPPATLNPASRVVVVESHARLLGLLVDSVALVAAVPRSAILPPPAEVRSRCSEHLVGVVALGGCTALLLDLDALLVLPTTAPVPTITTTPTTTVTPGEASQCE